MFWLINKKINFDWRPIFFFTGRNEKGQLGLGNTTRKDVPTVVEALSEFNIVEAACGRNHTLFLTGILAYCFASCPTKGCAILTLNAPISTKVVCFSRLLKCLRSLYSKQCGPRSDCSYRSSLFLVQAVCFYTYFVGNVRQLFAAEDFSRRHFQIHFSLGALRVNLWPHRWSSLQLSMSLDQVSRYKCIIDLYSVFFFHN